MIFVAAEVDAADGREVDREQQQHVPAASLATTPVHQLIHQERLRYFY